MLENILLSEIKKRKHQIEDDITKLQKEREEISILKKSKSEVEMELKELEEKFNTLQNLKIQESKYDYILEMEDGTYELSKKEDISPATSLTSDMILKWVDEKKIPNPVYSSIAKDNTPLPNELYVDQRSGKAWAQLHWRGISDEQYKSYKSGKSELWEILVGQSMHIDLRIDYGLEKLVQYVITESDLQSIYRMMIGEHRETAGGIMNVQHSYVTSKPSGEPPEGPDKFYKSEEEKLPSIDEEGAKLATEIIIDSGSYWIEPGQIGSTTNTYSYMSLIWLGKVITGVERHDLHELFLFKSKANKDILNGKFTIKCLNDGQSNRWEIWKSISNLKAMDSIQHNDCGYHYLVPSEKVDGIGREFYRKMSVDLFNKKYGN